MADVGAALTKYINDNLRLSQTEIGECAKSRQWVLDRVKAVIDQRSNEPVLYSARPFVNFGSYFKYTKVSTVDEYDVLVVIDSNNGVFRAGGSVVGTGVGSADPNHKYDAKYLKSDGSGVSPRILMNWLHGVVDEALSPWGVETPERNGQAVTAYIKSKDISIDLVPAGIFAASTGSGEFYNIPNGKADNDWILTAPQTDMARLQTVAAGKSDFRNVIRMVKKTSQTYALGLPSFACESAVTEFGATAEWSDYLVVNVVKVFLHMAKLVGDGSISDPFDPQKNLIADVSTTKRTSAVKVYSGIGSILMDLMERTELSQAEVNEQVRRLFETD